MNGITTSAKCSGFCSRPPERAYELTISRILFNLMSAWIGAEEVGAKMCDSKWIAGHHESCRTLNETSECAFEVVTTNVLCSGISHIDSLGKHREKTIIGILATCSPPCNLFARQVVHFNLWGIEQIDAMIVNCYVAHIATYGEVSMQTSVETI